MSTEGGHRIEVRNNLDTHRYEASIDGQSAGYTVYVIVEGRHWFTHTQIDPAYDDQEVGSFLVRWALDDMRAQDATIVPVCPFLEDWIGRHPEYEDLVDTEALRQYRRDNKIKLRSR